MIYLLILALNFSVHAVAPAKTPANSKKTAEVVTVEPVNIATSDNAALEKSASDKAEIVSGDVFDLEGQEKLFTYESDRKYTVNT